MQSVDLFIDKMMTTNYNENGHQHTNFRSYKVQLYCCNIYEVDRYLVPSNRLICPSKFPFCALLSLFVLAV